MNGLLSLFKPLTHSEKYALMITFVCPGSWEYSSSDSRNDMEEHLSHCFNVVQDYKCHRSITCFLWCDPELTQTLAPALKVSIKISPLTLVLQWDKFRLKHGVITGGRKEHALSP